MTRHVLTWLTWAIVLTPTWASAQGTGRLVGELSHRDGGGIRGALVHLVELRWFDVTDSEGRFAFDDLRPGLYTIQFTYGDESLTKPPREVSRNTTTVVSAVVSWNLAFAETLTVSAVSRRQERIVDAPAPVTTIDRRSIGQRAVMGQVPRLLAATTGVELSQVSLNDFNLNTRGFNTAFNRRVLTIIDGRDPSIPGLTGAQEWGTMLPADDLDRVEFVRGPGAALYGAGAFNGVLVITSKAPRETPGGSARISLGELSTQRYEVRHAGAVGEGWFYKGLAGAERGRTFTRSRVDDVEYAPGTLPRETIGPPRDDYERVMGSFRVDKELARDRLFTLESGLASFAGTTNVSDLGRVQQGRVTRPWFRANLNAPHWNMLSSYSRRRADDQAVLSSGSFISLESSAFALEAQGNHPFLNDRGRLVGGVFYGRQSADSRDREGLHTIYADVKNEHDGAVYGQVDYDFTNRLKGVFSLRWDGSTLHDARWSPRMAMVYSVASGHTFRVTYNDAFKRPTLSELFVNVAVAQPVDLSELEQALEPVLDGVPLGFEAIPILGVGNANLAVEEISSVEVGYNAVLGTRVFLALSLYRNRLKNFTTPLLPQLGTSFGRLNENFGPYSPPSSLDPTSADIVLTTLQGAIPGLFPIMSNGPDDFPIFVAISNRSFGRVNAHGVEVSLQVVVAPGWSWTGSYNHLDFTVVDEAPESALVPNAPAHQFATGTTYDDAQHYGMLTYRWVDGFLWSTGVFSGPVESYGVVDGVFRRQLTPAWNIGVDVANMLNNRHYEVFGGDLLGRRVLGSLTHSW